MMQAKSPIIRVYLRFPDDLDTAINIFKERGGTRVENKVTNYQFYAYVWMDDDMVIHADPVAYYVNRYDVIDLSEYEFANYSS